jgi:hypothetical protein
MKYSVTELHPAIEVDKEIEEISVSCANCSWKGKFSFWLMTHQKECKVTPITNINIIDGIYKKCDYMTDITNMHLIAVIPLNIVSYVC